MYTGQGCPFRFADGVGGGRGARGGEGLRRAQSLRSDQRVSDGYKGDLAGAKLGSALAWLS